MRTKRLSSLRQWAWVAGLLVLVGLMLACAASPQEIAATAAPTLDLTVEALNLPPLEFPTATPLPQVAENVPPENLPPPATEAPVEAGTQQVNIYLIALEDGGISGPAIGCGDSVVPVTIEIPATEGILRAALENLLAMKDQYYGESGLYNALYQSDLQVSDVTIVAGQAQVYLTGSLMLGGECDSPRLQAQLEQTALQFATVQAVSIFINGEPLAEALSLDGD